MLKSLCYVVTGVKNQSADKVKAAITNFSGFHSDSDFDGLKERMIQNAGTQQLLILSFILISTDYYYHRTMEFDFASRSLQSFQS